MRKKIIGFILCLAVTLSIMPANAKDSGISVYLDDEQISFGVPPLIKNDRTMVPVREVFEAFGMFVSWNSGVVTASGKNTVIMIYIGGDTIMVNGSLVKTDSPSVIIDDRTYVPLAVIAKSLDMDVEWDEKSQSVYITSPDTPQVTEKPSDEKPSPSPGTEEPAEGEIYWDISDGPVEVYDGAVINMSANEFGTAVSWSSSNKKAASVDENGVVTANEGGDAVIMCFSLSSGQFRQCRVLVKQAVRPVLPDEIVKIKVDEKKELPYSVTPAGSGEILKWSSSNEDAVTVNATGYVTGIDGGTAVITAVSSTGHTASCEVMTELPSSRVTLNKKNITLNDGTPSYQLEAILTPTNSTDEVTWTSSDSQYAIVDEDGVVTGLESSGSRDITITATTSSGKKATCKVSVYMKAVVPDLDVIQLISGKEPYDKRVENRWTTDPGEPAKIVIQNNSKGSVNILNRDKSIWIHRNGNDYYLRLCNDDTLNTYSGNSLSILPGETKELSVGMKANSGNEGFVIKSSDEVNFRFTCTGRAYVGHAYKNKDFYFE